MAMSVTLKSYLDRNNIDYQTVHHHPSDTAFNSAKTAHIPTSSMVKGVLLTDNLGFVIAATTATRSLDLGAIQPLTNRSLALAKEDDLPKLLEDCESRHL